ncbi:MFS general substrate transporter, partial [Aulographum hederae CBS 113979]
MPVVKRPTPFRLASYTSLDSLLTRKEQNASNAALNDFIQHASTVTLGSSANLDLDDIEAARPVLTTGNGQSRFRSLLVEVCFVFSMAMTQFLTEYSTFGFGIILPALEQHGLISDTVSALWPTSVLTLIVSAFTLPFSRLSDMYGGYPFFICGLLWLALWSLIGSFSKNEIMLNVARAMQGLAIAAFQPASFSLIGSSYKESRRKNIVFGIYGACAPVGSYFGMFVSGLAVKSDHWNWYFWTAAAIAFISAVFAYLSVPMEPPERHALNLKMDWYGAGTVVTGLMLVAYALSASSHADKGWASPGVLAPFSIGVLSLIAAVVVEWKFAACPLMPAEFFKPKGLKPMMLMLLLWWGCFGLTLFYATFYMEQVIHIPALQMAIWFLPMAIFGVVMATVGGIVMSLIPFPYLLSLAGAGWIIAPLLLSFVPSDSSSKSYWAFIFPALLALTLGSDLTYTVSNIFMTNVQPLQYQGLAGAFASVLVNLGVSVSISLADILSSAVEVKNKPMVAIRVVFWFAAGLSAAGLILCVLFVRIPKPTSHLTPDE